jgi:hypothetical protein
MADVAAGSEGFCAAVVPVAEIDHRRHREHGETERELAGGLRSLASCAGLAVAADVLAELAVEFGGLLDTVFEHGAPLFGVVVEGDGAEQEAGLENDFEGVAEVVGEAANLFGLLLGDGLGLHG